MAWDAAIRQANIRISLLILGVSVVMVSSLFPVYHVATAYQKHRLLSGTVTANDFDYWALTHDFGRPGIKLIDDLRNGRITAPDMQVVQERIRVLDKSEYKYAWEQNQRNPTQALMTQAQMVDAVPVYPAGVQLPEGARALLVKSDGYRNLNVAPDTQPFFYVYDLNGDGLTDVLIFQSSSTEPTYLKNTKDGWKFGKVSVVNNNGSYGYISGEDSPLRAKMMNGTALKTEFVAKGLGDDKVFIIPQD